MFQAVGFCVYLVPGDAQHLGQEQLPQPVDAQQAQRLLPSFGREGHALVGHVLDQALAVQLAHHARDGGRRHLQVGGQFRGGHGRLLDLKAVDGL